MSTSPSTAGAGTGVVVAAALVRDGRVLGGRRRYPEPLAGRLELPGGKVEAGETEHAALVRECAEELGVEIEVGARLGADQALDRGFVLRAFWARLRPGSTDPVPGPDHGALAWFAPEDLDAAGWLPADRGVLPALRERLLDGEPLAGGNVGGAVRIGDTVRRPAGPWTATVRELLEHLHQHGLSHVPEPLGVDERGREVLTLLPGHTLGALEGHEWPPWAFSDRLLGQAGRWLGRYHAAVRSFRPEGSRPWRPGRARVGPDELVCHNDFAPYNLVVDDAGDLAGVLDWDVAGPGRPIDDLAFAAWNFVPLFREEPDAPTVRRLRLLADAYADPGVDAGVDAGVDPGVDAGDILDAVPDRIARSVTTIRSGAGRGDAGMQHLIDIGEVAATEERLARLLGRRATLTRALHRAGTYGEQ